MRQYKKIQLNSFAGFVEAKLLMEGRFLFFFFCFFFYFFSDSAFAAFLLLLLFCFCCFFAFVSFLLLLLFCFCCFSASTAFLLLLFFCFLGFCLSALCFCCFSALAAVLLSLFVCAFPFVCFVDLFAFVYSYLSQQFGALSRETAVVVAGKIHWNCAGFKLVAAWSTFHKVSYAGSIAEKEL